MFAHTLHVLCSKDVLNQLLHAADTFSVFQDYPLSFYSILIGCQRVHVRSIIIVHQSAH